MLKVLNVLKRGLQLLLTHLNYSAFGKVPLFLCSDDDSPVFQYSSAPVFGCSLVLNCSAIALCSGVELLSNS